VITAADTEFPNNIIALLVARIPTFCDPTGSGDNALKVFSRPLRTSDPTQSVGVFPAMKRPNTDSFEIGRTPEPTVKTYSVILQTVVQDTDESACISVHSILSNRLWRMFYRDSPLNIGLTALAVDANNSRERLQRRGIELQRYLSNEIQGSYVQTSWIECWFETETVETP
jgi:hypothetical protein